MSGSTTNYEMLGKLDHEIDTLEKLIETHNKPIKEKIKKKKEQHERLLLEDGRQVCDLGLLGED